MKDFLVATRLGFTLKVYEPEVRLGDDDIGREQLAGILVRPPPLCLSAAEASCPMQSTAPSKHKISSCH